mmetsp:Transcript_21500/g.69206  ORF Transcript_21500/g.69206 Transcript_21500/m.69206 type:complete len:212 (-) Transcript_21500:424-1059(-)
MGGQLLRHEGRRDGLARGAGLGRGAGLARVRSLKDPGDDPAVLEEDGCGVDGGLEGAARVAAKVQDESLRPPVRQIGDGLVEAPAAAGVELANPHVADVAVDELDFPQRIRDARDATLQRQPFPASQGHVDPILGGIPLDDVQVVEARQACRGLAVDLLDDVVRQKPRLGRGAPRERRRHDLRRPVLPGRQDKPHPQDVEARQGLVLRRVQ